MSLRESRMLLRVLLHEAKRQDKNIEDLTEKDWENSKQIVKNVIEECEETKP